MKKRMKIGFLLGSPDINGGTYVIYEHATRLIVLGHQITIITEQQISPERYAWHPKAQTLEWLTIAKAEKREFDIVLATWWQSPFLLTRLMASHYVYFIQSIESRFFEEEDPAHHDQRDLSIWKQYCESTYACNISIITEAQWIQAYLKGNHNKSSFLVRNGIRKDIYQPKGNAISERTRGKLRVLAEGPVDVHNKNVPKSIELCRKAGADEIWLLTSSDINSFEGVDRVFARIPINETPEIFRSCDVLVKLSYVEGMFGPPLEMFHCGGTAIVYDVTGHDEYIIHNENSYVVPRDDEEQVVRHLQKLKKDPEELQHLKAGAKRTADSWPDWHAAASKFEDALRRISSREPVSRSYLMRWSDDMTANNIARFRAKDVERFQQRERGAESEDDDPHNFVQLYYWAEKDGLDAESFQWAYYKSGKPAEINLQVSVTGFPFWLRLDPSVRIGMVIIDSITITNRRLNKQLFLCNAPDHFDALYIGGTLHRIEHREKAVYLSFGDDPQLILPAVTEGEIGDDLSITICLQELGVASYVDHFYQMNATEDQLIPTDTGLVDRFLRKVKRSLM